MMINNAFHGVAAAGMPAISHVVDSARPAHPITAAAVVAAPRKRRAAAGTVAVSVRGFR